MNHSVPEHQLARLSEFIESKLALHFPPPRWSELESKISATAKELGHPDTASFIEVLLSSSLANNRMEILASHLTIGETFFWREPRAFEALEHLILPELIRTREAQGDRTLRVWCAGCSSGEEAYSVAMALLRVLRDIHTWKIVVLATDINPRMLRKAEQGTYGEWSFRNAPHWLKKRFFLDSKGGKYTIIPELRSMVRFAYLNLAEDMYPSALNDTNAMDIIFCRNVLMYFTSGRARQIIEKFTRSLTASGWLFPAACECSQLLFSDLTTVPFHETTAYRKRPDRQKQETAPQQRPGCDRRTQESPKAAQGIPASRKTSVKQPLVPSPGAAMNRLPPIPTQSIEARIMELADRGRLSDALDLCRSSIEGDRVNPKLHYLEAAVLQELNLHEEAMISLKRCLYLDHRSVSANFTLGNLAMRAGDMRTGRHCLRNALDLLAGRPDEDILQEADGLTIGRFREIITASLWKLRPSGKAERELMEVP